LVCADVVNFLGENINTYERQTDTDCPLFDSREVDVTANAGKTDDTIKSSAVVFNVGYTYPRGNAKTS
jgi:hypothetical protein